MMQSEIWEMTEEAELLQHCAPIFFQPTKNPDPQAIYANGTVGLINIGQRRLLVTCAHVWTEFESYRKKNPKAQLGVIFTNGWALPERIAEPIDLDESLDLVVFEAHPEVWNMGYKQFHTVQRWPVPHVKAGDMVNFLGFAGEGRHTNAGIGNFTYSFFRLRVTDSSDRRFLLADSNGSNRILMDNNRNARPPMNMGGLSGSPAYVRNEKGVISLAGFVQQGKTSSDMTFLIHSSSLQPDGMLKR